MTRAARTLPIALGLLTILSAAGCGTVSGQAVPAPADAMTPVAHGAAQLRFREVIGNPMPADAPGSTGTVLTPALRQATDSTVQQQALTALACNPATPDPLVDNDNPSLPLVTCDQSYQEKYVLGPVFLDGSQVAEVGTSRDPNGPGYLVNLTFTTAGARTWANFTEANVGHAAAFVLDTRVVSAPTIDTAIMGGNTQISGNFTQAQAQDFVDALTGG